MHRLILAASALTGLLFAPVAQAQQGYVWTAYTDTDSALIGATFGVPETDDTAIYLECVLDGPLSHVRALFSAPTGQIAANAPVTFAWRTAAGAAEQDAIVLLAEEFGGVSLTAPLDASLLWQLTAAPELTYGVGALGQGGEVTLSLGAGQSEAAFFLSACRTAAEGQSADTGPLVPEFGPGTSGHDWSRFSQVSDNIFDTILNVTYGVPETDDVLVMGQCFIGAQEPLVALQIAADIEGMAELATASLRITNGAGQVAEVEGSVVGAAAEVGISGVELILEMSHPAWLVIAGDPTVRFERVGGRGGFTLTGNGPQTLAPFLTDCDEIGDLTPEGGLSPSAPVGEQQGFMSCDSFGRVGSRNIGQPMVLTFINESGAFRGLEWVDPDGNPVQQSAMNPGEQVSFTTDPGHIWMATDGPGNCREMIEPVPGQTIYRLLAQ